MSKTNDNVKMVKIDGKEYFMKFTFKSSNVLERLTGKSVTALFDNEDELGTNTITAIFHACLIPFKKGQSFEDTEDLIDSYIEDGGDLTELMEKMTSVIEESDFLKSLSSK